MARKILLASFIFNDRIEWFINLLLDKFKVNKDTIEVYEYGDIKKKLIIFKIDDESILKKNYDLFPNVILIHKKEKTLYTINALNKLIESIYGANINGINYKDVKINWVAFKDQLLITNKDQLDIIEIKYLF